VTADSAGRAEPDDALPTELRCGKTFGFGTFFAYSIAYTSTSARAKCHALLYTTALPRRAHYALDAVGPSVRPSRALPMHC